MSTVTAGKHTPGPWTQERFGSVVGGPFLQYANGKAQSQIASATVGAGIEPEEREANARLIAAAPELLAALQDMVLLLSTVANVYDANQIKFLMDKPTYAKAQAAIAKAVQP